MCLYDTLLPDNRDLLDIKRKTRAKQGATCARGAPKYNQFLIIGEKEEGERKEDLAL